MFFQAGEASLYYETSGNGQPIVLLHGNGESGQIFDQLIPPLSKKHRVFALDSRDHGQSQVTGKLSYQNMARDLILFCKGLKLDKPTVYGFSDGGIVGLLAASEAPECFGRLVISGANIRPDGLKWWFRTACRAGYFFSRKPRVKMMLTEPDISAAQLKNITIPTLVLAGEHDLIRPAHTAEIAAAIPQAEMKILKGEDHGSYIIHSRKLMEYL